MRRASSKRRERETWLFRLLAGVIAVPVFELSLYLALYVGGGARRSGRLFFSIPVWMHITYIGVAVLVGLLFGFGGITWILGHLFLTHDEQDKDARITIALWVAMLLLGGLGYLSAR